MDPELDPRERLERALGEVKHAYEASPEHERGIEPGLALRALVVSLNLGAGMTALGLDYSLAQALPSIAPFQPLSPAFEVTERLVGAVAARVSGRHDYARTAYAQIVERLGQPDCAGLQPSNHRFMHYGVMYGLALIEAGMGLQSSLVWAVCPHATGTSHDAPRRTTMSTTTKNTLATKTVSQGESRYGTPEPQIAVRFPKGTSYRVVKVALHKLAADVELATPASERWCVNTEDESESGRVYLELADATPAETARGMAMLTKLVG